jgi:hypothetical protein
MTPDEFRQLALALEGAIEGAHMGHPDFRVNGKIFATLQANDAWGVVMVTPEEQRELMRTDARTFVPAAGAWGLRGCTQVRLETAAEADVRGALILAWEDVRARSQAKRSSRQAAARRTSGKSAQPAKGRRAKN